MKQKRYVGTFHSIDNVLVKITELKSLGYTSDEILAVSNLQDDDRMLEDQTDIVLASKETDGFLARVKYFFTNDQPAKDAFELLGFNEQQAQAFYNEVKDGGVAMFVKDDRESPKHPNPADTSKVRDSSGETSESGVPLEHADVESEENAGRYPRINADKL